MFDAIRFFEDYGIRYWTSGKNVASGFINTQCPHCDDRSNHLGWDGTGTICWRCGHHSLFESIKEILNCDDKMAKMIIKTYQAESNSDFVPESEDIHAQRLEMIGMPLQDVHKRYLEHRGFDPDYVEWKFGLKGTFARSDGWAYRIISPITYKHRLVSYQGRDYTGRQELRYLTLGKDKEIIHHKNILYNLDNCNKDSVMVVEGVYDCMKMDDDCCCTFGVGYTENQVALLAERFKRVFLMFDNEVKAQERAEDIGRKLKLAGIDVERIIIDEADDAGDLTLSQVKGIKRELGF